MGRKGQRYAYRVKFRFPDQDPPSKVHSRPADTIADAAQCAIEAQNVGAEVSIWYIAPGSSANAMTLIQRLDAAGPIPDGYRLCSSCGRAFPVDQDTDDGRSIKPFTTHASGGPYERCETEIDPSEIEEAYEIDKEITPRSWRVYMAPSDGSDPVAYLEAHRYTDARNRAMAREDYEQAVIRGVYARLTKVMHDGQEVAVAEHQPLTPGDFFTPEGVKAKADYFTHDAVTKMVGQRNREVVANELERIIADPASYNDRGAIDPTALTLWIKELRGL